MENPDFTKVHRNGQKWMSADSMIGRMIRNYLDIESVVGHVDLALLKKLSTDPNGPLRISDIDDAKLLERQFTSKLTNLKSNVDGCVFYIEGEQVRMYDDARAILEPK